MLVLLEVVVVVVKLVGVEESENAPAAVARRRMDASRRVFIDFVVVYRPSKIIGSVWVTQDFIFNEGGANDVVCDVCDNAEISPNENLKYVVPYNKV
jgi:hypothetical protein